MFDGLKVVLVVDDAFDYANRIAEEMQKKAHVAFVAYDLCDVWQTISNIPGGLESLDLIIQDGSVSYGYTRRDGSEFRSPDGKLVHTLEFIRDLRASGYTGPIMANSASDHNNDQMIEAGATHHGDTLRPWGRAQKILSGEA
jgi:DNA-binding response OmpR family regulator